MGDGDYIHAFTKIVMPIAMEFAPELVISEQPLDSIRMPFIQFSVSAGFDAAEGDDLGGCHVSPGCYAHMTHMLVSLAGGKVVAALEVGINVLVMTSGPLIRLLGRL